MHSTPSTPTTDAIPELKPGVTILHQSSRHSTAFHQVAIAELSRRDGIAYWLDARNNASSHALFDHVDHPRQLRSLRIARAFTAYQYHALVRTIARTVTPKTSLLVSPVPADLFRDDDVPEPEDRAFLEAAVRVLQEIARVYKIPVLLSTARQDDLGEIVTDAADRELEYDETELGYRFEGEVDPEDLVIDKRVSKPLEAYTQRTHTVAALQRYREHGIEKRPGQHVEYVVVDDGARRTRERVRLPFEIIVECDAEWYAGELVRACESIVSALGWTRVEIERYLRDQVDVGLSAFE